MSRYWIKKVMTLNPDYAQHNRSSIERLGVL